MPTTHSRDNVVYVGHPITKVKDSHQGKKQFSNSMRDSRAKVLLHSIVFKILLPQRAMKNTTQYKYNLK